LDATGGARSARQKIVLATFGTRGDVQPMLALGAALRARGHLVPICAPEGHRALVEEHGFPFVACGRLDPRGDDWRDGGTALVLSVRAQIGAQIDALLSACEGASALVASMFMFGAASAAELRGIPLFYAVYWPLLLRSPGWPIIGMPVGSVPRWLSRPLWWLQDLVWTAYFRGPVNRERRRRGLAPVSNALDHLAYSGHLLLAYDEEIGHLPPVPEAHSRTGYWHVAPRGELPAEVEHFLASGPPPVYFGFGSMRSRHPERLARLFVDAAGAAGVRALMSAESRSQLPESCLRIGALPHGLLFPRVAAAIHHCGAGTTAAAARAGVPQIPVPHFGDQFYWGHALHRLGVAPRPIRRSRLTAERLAAAIREGLAKGVAAKALAGRLRGKEGAERAAEVIEKVARG